MDGSPPAATRGPLVLVVDDQPLVLGVLGRHLARAGYRVRLASSGPEALELLREASVDLLLTDVQMPGMDGLELIGRAHREAPELPVIVMSGFIGEGIAPTRIPHPFLPKPFGANELYRTVEEALGGASTHD